MAEKNATIYDVAQKAGLSIATISRVINNPSKVSPKTKNKVFKIMEDLGFTPKAEARERARRHVGRIGILAPHFTLPSFVQRLRGISEALKGNSYEMVVIAIEEEHDVDYYLRSSRLTNRLDGIILLSLQLEEKTINLVKKQNIHVVFVEFGHPDFSSICVDNYHGGHLAAQHLVKLGYKDFLVISEEEKDERVHPNHLRVDGFVDALDKLNIPFSLNNIKLVPANLESAAGIIIEHLSKEQKTQVIFATTDFLGIAALKAARKMELKVPQDLGIIGFDGTNLSDYMDLSTVDQALEESGRLAVEIILRELQRPESPHQTIYLPLKIIERETLKLQESK